MDPRNTSSFSQRGCIRGFSLFELVTVLVLLGIVAVFAAPRLFTTQSITLFATTAQLAASIRYAQSLSMSRGQRYRVNFTANSYQITDMLGGVVQPATANTGTALVSVVPTVLNGYNPPLTLNYVAFDTKGVPYTSATVALAVTATITLTSGGESSTITIAPETGRVK